MCLKKLFFFLNTLLCKNPRRQLVKPTVVPCLSGYYHAIKYTSIIVKWLLTTLAIGIVISQRDSKVYSWVCLHLPQRRESERL